MSKLGEMLIGAVESAKVSGLVTLQASPDVVELRKKLKLSLIKLNLFKTNRLIKVSGS